MTNKIVTLQNQIAKANLTLNTLHHSYEVGDITLEELVAGELKVGLKYSWWAENIDKQSLKDKRKKEITQPTEEIESLFNSFEYGGVSRTKNWQKYSSHDLMIPPINDDRYTPEEFCDKYGPNSNSFYRWNPNGKTCVHDWKVDDCYVCVPTGE